MKVFYQFNACEHTGLCLLLSDDEFGIPAKYFDSKIGVLGRPVGLVTGKEAKMGWKVWNCAQELSEFGPLILPTRKNGDVSLRFEETREERRARKFNGRSAECAEILANIWQLMRVWQRRRCKKFR